jgi:3-phenylpropionate/trans-cinnamate dioxygenase ferredoxin reductase subunit
VLVVGREQDPPYERPPLSKSYLAGRSERGDALYLPETWWQENEVELLARTSVMKLDTEARVARLQSKEEVRFGKALVATGAMVRRLRVDGSDLDGLHYLRAFGNADAIRADAESAGRVVLIGGSYIACELAATLTALGHDCAMLMQEEVTLERHFGREVGAWVQRQLEERGVEVHGGDELERFEGSGERVEGVVSAGGVVLEAGCVVLGTGVTPDVMLARAAGLELGERGGVRCSARLETSAPGVWSAGDACEYDSVVHGRRLRVEHWEVARAQGAAVAAAILGSHEPFAEVPYFWADLADWCTLEYVGPAREWDEEVLRGSTADGEFTIFYLSGGRVVAALTVGRSDDLDRARELMIAGEPVSPEAL